MVPATQHRKGGVFLALLLLTLQFSCSATVRAAPSSNDIYATIEVADKAMDVILRKAKGVTKVSSPEINDSQLGTMHAYQLHIACLDQIRILEIKLKLRPFPKIVASPVAYQAEDVLQLSAIIRSEVRRIAIHLNIWGMPEVDQDYRNKTYNDVVRLCLAVFMKLRTLGDLETISMADAFSEFPRGVADIKSILTHIDPAQRYRIDLAPENGSAELTAVYEECLALRHDLNTLRRFYRLKEVVVPTGPPHKNLQPCDIYIQSQIILAELNALKKASNTSSISPEAIPVTDKTAADLLYQVKVLRYLANQLPTLSTMVQ
ncbi:MAG: hypothetical protein KKD73_05910 [Proteobacteria bacterium]|nr:hypothetical protein [Pseudomonadota bacterium]MBU1639292.1 hypothetical protein [Pseudomonadota bacterium]